MKRLMCLFSAVLMGFVFAQDVSRLHTQPQPKKPFKLTYYDIRQYIVEQNPQGRIIVDFFINEKGEVEDPNITDTFNINLNAVVLAKLNETSYYPATQNGVPVKIRYTLPIVFK
jgi:hypothetical protein